MRPSGWGFIVIGMLVQLAAWNSGTNLLYVVASVIISIILPGFLLTGGSLRGLKTFRTCPASVHKFQPFSVTVRVENRKKYFPAFSLQIDSLDGAPKGGTYIEKLPRRKAGLFRFRHRIDKRGVHKLPPVTLRSAFPFGLFRRTVQMDDRVEIVVYPRIRSVRAASLEQLDGLGTSTQVRRGEGDEFFSLRDYVPGDEIRRIAWRVSGRLGHLVVRELEPSTSHNIFIEFDTHRVADMEDFEAQFEEAVDLTASLAISFINKQYCVGLLTPSGNVPLGEGAGHAKAILEALARVEPVDEPTSEYIRTEQMAGSGFLLISPDPAQWGKRSHDRGVRILDPREVLRA